MRITINLLLKKAKKKSDGTVPIYIRCTLEGKRIELSSGIAIAPEHWNNAAQVITNKHPNSKVLNAQINKFVIKIQDAYNQLESIGDDFDINSVKEKLINKPSYFLIKTFLLFLKSIEYKVHHGYSINTLKSYNATYSRIRSFIEKKYSRTDIHLSKVNHDFITGFDSYLRVEHSVNPNTASKYHKQLKKVLNEAIARGYIDSNPYSSFKIKRYQGNRDYLSIHELNVVEDKNFNIERISMVRDVFVFACYTGLSFSDINQLTRNHLSISENGNEWIIIDRIKTNNRCRIPLLPKAKAIIKKYKDFPSNNAKGRLLPLNSNQKMNSYLKEIADICGISKNLTMHVARHTFATSVTLANGVPIETVAKMLGHNSIKTTEIYGRILDAKIENDMKGLMSMF